MSCGTTILDMGGDDVDPLPSIEALQVWENVAMGEFRINSSPETGAGSGGTGDEPVPFMQRLLDNHFLLLALGVAVPAVLYVIWGVMEIAQIPIAQ